MTNPLFGLALVTGFLGTGHCLGMCGGLVSALALSPEGRRAGPFFHLLYHLGRLSTYALIGLAVGWLGSSLILPVSIRPYTLYLLLASDLLVVALGLGSAGLWSRLDPLREGPAGGVRLLGKVVGRLQRFPAPVAVLLLGGVLGFLPCCFLYAMALTAAQSGAPLAGAGVMLAFGLGTVPGLVAVGGAAQWLGKRGRLWMVRAAGVTVALMGAWNFWRHLHLF